MASDLTTTDVLSKLGITESQQAADIFQTSGIMPEVITGDLKKSIFVLGITPEAFRDQFSSVEFDFNDLMSKFTKYCKDFGDDIQQGKSSRALEFAARMIFEVGPYIRNEKKSKGDKVVRFRFPYNKGEDGTVTLSVKTVIVSTFKDTAYSKMEVDEKLILTFKQAGMLAMVTFMKAIKFAYSQDSAKVLMTPLCGAVFSRESIFDMGEDLKLHECEIIKMINASSSTGGQFLPESDMACAIVCTISTTRRVTNKDIRMQMITKIIKQYAAKHKQYEAHRFNVFSKHALGGVPPGMDAQTMIENFSN